MADKKDFWSSGFGSFLNNMLFGLPSLIGGLVGSSQLTGAEREQNEWNAEQSAIQRQFEAQQSEQANQFSAEQAQINRQFQADMSNTAYQRAVTDMRAAGVNPALAMSNGAASTPSGSSPSGVAGSGSAASGTGRGMPFTMSEVMSALRMRKEMKVLDAQAENIKEDTANKVSERLKRDIEASWLPKKYASELDINSKLLEKYSAEVASVLASTEGQKILNEWNPKLFASQLENDKINRADTIAGIAKIQQEVQNLIAQEVNTYADTDLKHFQQALVAAQTSLASMQEREVGASAWRKEWENSFTELTGVKPDEPLWNAVTSVLAETGVKIRDVVQNPGNYIKNAVKRWRDFR